jgi:hypothetical protein
MTEMGARADLPFGVSVVAYAPKTAPDALYAHRNSLGHQCQPRPKLC